MANVRDSDTSLWLHNKLGTSNDSWTGGSICTQLNAEVLRNIKDCFPDLQTQVKLKLLLSFFHIPRRNVEEWQSELDEIIEVACVDSELWVSMLAEVMKTFPSTGSLNTQVSEFEEIRPIFSDMINELKRLVNKQSEMGMLPLECHYLNKAALTSLAGAGAGGVSTKHFTLRRKPKSCGLRTELLSRAADIQQQQHRAQPPPQSRSQPPTATHHSIPPRPLKNAMSRWNTGRGGILPRISAGRITPAGNNTSTHVSTHPLHTNTNSHHHRPGIKLLDIADQPLSYHTTGQRKRKKIEIDEQPTSKKSQATPVTNADATPMTTTANAVTTSSKIVTTTTSTTVTSQSQLPEYARNLPVYAMPSAPAVVTTSVVTPLTTTTSTPVPPPVPRIVVAPATPQPPPPVTPTPPVVVPPVPIVTQIVSTSVVTPPIAAVSHANVVTSAPISSTPTLVMPARPVMLAGQPRLLLAQGRKPLLLANGVPLLLRTHAPRGTLAQVTPGVTGVTQGVILQTRQPQNIIIQAPPLVPTDSAADNTPGLSPISSGPGEKQAQPALLPRRGLSLTRDQMLEAQDMFRNANRVTRPEKALILGFMAGSRDNPCPNLGNIVTIKLSENQEMVRQEDGSLAAVLCEMHFQMNYNNGQWMRIKKYRPLDISVTVTTAQAPATAQ